MTDTDDSDPLLPRILAGGGAAALTSLVPGLAVAVGAALPVVEACLTTLWTFLSGTAEEGGVDVDDLLAAAEKSETHQQLLRDAALAATSTTSRLKVEALKRAVANGLLDDTARVDVELLTVHALADLEAIHIRFLVQVVEEDTDTLFRVAELLDDVVRDPVLNALQRHALVERVDDYETPREDRNRAAAGSYGGPPSGPITPRVSWRITKFGRHCLGYLLPEPDALGSADA